MLVWRSFLSFSAAAEAKAMLFGDHWTDRMKSPFRYGLGQRWAFKGSVAEFENSLVIGAVNEAHPEWGSNERTYEVYVRYSDVAKPAIPPEYDGTILSLTDKALDRNVTELVGTNVRLPWWWVYGRRLRSNKDAPNSRGKFSCDRISDVLPLIFQHAKQVAERARTRQEAVRIHLEKPARRQRRPKPSKSVAESWSRIEAWYAENAYSLDRSSLAAGATAGTIRRFEKSIGAQLPEDFKESVRIHDGGGWWVPWRHGELLSLDGILKQWTMYCEWQAKGKYATDDWRPLMVKGPIRPVFWNKRRIYVTDNSGDHLTLDLDPPESGAYGQVLDHSHGVGPTAVVASGWGEFLRNLVEDLESGKYVYLEDEGGLELVEELERGLE
jgi:cell wall assembly regulator SMI1